MLEIGSKQLAILDTEINLPSDLVSVITCNVCRKTTNASVFLNYYAAFTLILKD